MERKIYDGDKAFCINFSSLCQTYSNLILQTLFHHTELSTWTPSCCICHRDEKLLPFNFDVKSNKIKLSHVVFCQLFRNTSDMWMRWFRKKSTATKNKLKSFRFWTFQLTFFWLWAHIKIKLVEFVFRLISIWHENWFCVRFCWWNSNWWYQRAYKSL